MYDLPCKPTAINSYMSQFRILSVWKPNVYSNIKKKKKMLYQSQASSLEERLSAMLILQLIDIKNANDLVTQGARASAGMVTMGLT